MTAHRSDSADQGGLWGPQPVPDTPPARAVTNDLELVADVIRAAMTRGYVLIGPAQRVFLRVDGDRKGGLVEPVPGYEQDTVHQLLDSGHLKIGGTHIVGHRGREGPAHSVLVPKASRAMVTRWGNYRPLHGGAAPPRKAVGPTRVVTPVLWCPECGERATNRPPVRWAPANGPAPEHSHTDGEPLCPVMTAQGYRPAKPTTRRPG